MKRSSYRMVDSLRLLIVLLDFLCFQLALIIGYYLWIQFPWHGNWQTFGEFSNIMLALPILAIIVFHAVGLYKPGMGVIGVQEQSLIFKATWIVYVSIFALSFFLRVVEVSRLATLYSMFISMLLISVERYFVRRWFSYLNEQGFANRKAVIYGAGYHGARLERWIRQTPHLGIRVIGYLDDQPENLNKIPDYPPLLGGIDKLSDAIESKDVSLVFIAHRMLTEEQVVDTIQHCRDFKVGCWVIPSLYKFRVEQVEVQHIGGIPLLGFKHQFAKQSYEVLKHAFDRIGALMLIILSLPLWLMVSVSVYLTSGKPIFFKQHRVGKNHREFLIYKFRTMRTGKRNDDISPELRKDTKQYLTPLGGLLRRSGLDEIPQLINVLKGEMSLVGPRPEMPFLVNKYGPLEKERLTVKPGITGLWQISDDRKRLLIHENMDYDLYYVEHMSFNLDLAILVKTFFAMLKRMKPIKED